MRPSPLVSSAAVALTACTLHAARPAVASPRPGVLLVLTTRAPLARCPVEVQRLPASTMALALAEGTEQAGLSGGIRAVSVEVEADRPLLVVELSPPATPPDDETTAARFCALAGELATRLERDPGELATAGAGPRWPLALDAGPAPGFHSVQRISRAGRTEGFAEYWIGARPGGARALVSRRILLVRQGATWWASDTVQVEETDAAGMLERGRYARFANGFQYRVELHRAGRGIFAYSGEAQGKPLEGTFEAAAGLTTTLLRVALFSERAGYGPAEPVRAETYDPSVDPARPSVVVYRRDPGTPRGIVTQVGTRSGNGVVDRDGTLEWIETADDPPARMETIWRAGAP